MPQYISKIILNGDVQMDVTQDTVESSNLLYGETATGADGAPVTGSIASKTSSDLTASGATVTVPAGYYSSTETKSVKTMTLPSSASTSASTGYASKATIPFHSGTRYLNIPDGYNGTASYYTLSEAPSMTLPTSADSSAASGYTSKATIGRSTSDQYINIPTGYNETGAYYKVSAVANGSATTPATTITANPTISVNSSTGVITATASATKSVTPTVSAGYVSSGTAGTITVSGSNTSNLSTQSGTTVSPTESEQTAVAAGKYTLGAVKVGAISSTYVGSGITQRSSTDLSASGATVTVPSGYYASQATKSVSSGTAGTPTATKGTVSNHSISVTPSVTNTAGYISGGTINGTAVSVSASELVSGSQTITENDTYNVTDLAEVVVDVPSSEPNLTTKTVTPTRDPYFATANTEIRTVNFRSDIDPRTSGVSASLQADIDPLTALTYNETYAVTGRIYVVDSEENVLEYYDVYKEFIWKETQQELVTNDSNAYYSYFNILKAAGSSNTKCGLYYGFQKTATYGFRANLSICEVNTTYDGLSLVVVNGYTPNLITSTVTPNDEAQIVTSNTPIRSVTTSSSGSSSRTAGTSSSISSYLSPSSALTDDEEYAVTGRIYAIDANNNILEYYDVNTTFIWKNTEQTIITNDANAYFSQFSLRKNTSTAVYLKYYCQKTAQYGFRSVLNICEISNYDGLSSVTVNPIPNTYYSSNLMQRLIERSISAADNFTFPSGITKIGGYAFATCNTFNIGNLPGTITTIGTYAFSGCSALALTSLPSGLTVIDTYAFRSCSRLALTSLPSGITSIKEGIFQNCTALALTSLPSGATGDIAQYAFYGCSNLALTSLPNGITSIKSGAFNSCTNLTLSSLPSGLTSISANAFSNCHSMTISTLPDTVTVIESSAFQYCNNITSISCNGTITTLGTSAFGASSTYPMQLTSARFPYMALTSTLSTVFGSSTAANACQLLEIVDIGTSTGIGSNAFANCYKLQTLILRKTGSVASLTANAFTNTPMAGYNGLTGTVYVPSALINSYKTATNWSTYYNNGTISFSAIEGSQYELS